MRSTPGWSSGKFLASGTLLYSTLCRKFKLYSKTSDKLEKILFGTNTLAYFAAALVTKEKKGL